MSETPVYCDRCGHQFLVHVYGHFPHVCDLETCACTGFVRGLPTPAPPSDAGLEDALFGRLRFRREWEQGAGRP